MCARSDPDVENPLPRRWCKPKSDREGRPWKKVMDLVPLSQCCTHAATARTLLPNAVVVLEKAIVRSIQIRLGRTILESRPVEWW
jgi:hypothetical protein